MGHLDFQVVHDKSLVVDYVQSALRTKYITYHVRQENRLKRCMGHSDFQVVHDKSLVVHYIQTILLIMRRILSKSVCDIQ